MVLRIYDTRSRMKKNFTPLLEGEVSIYVCGITPYSPSHLGHARQAISFDIITRWFRKLGFKVTYITNFTDIDDKIIKVALEENIDFQEVSKRNIENYFDVMDKSCMPLHTHNIGISLSNAPWIKALSDESCLG